MKTTRRSLASLALLTTFALAACGGTGAATTGPGGPAATTAGGATQPAGGGTTPTQAAGGNGGAAVDACKLLTDEEIKSATGFSPKSSAAAPDMGTFPAGCEWELDNEGAASWSITLGVMPTGGRSFYDGYVAPPVGEGEVGDVTVVKGDTTFSVLYIEFPTRDEVAVELAKAVAAKL